MSADLTTINDWNFNRCLCLIRGEHLPHREHGFLTRRAPVVELGYVWDGGTGEQKHYESFEAMFADGWKID